METSKKLRVLSADGGGIFGILSIQVLIRLEQKLSELSGQPKKIGEYFDLFAGTSTGGIITATLNCPDEEGKVKYSAQDLLKLYVDTSPVNFGRSFAYKLKTLGGLIGPKYPADGLRQSLTQFYGELKLSELAKPALFTSYDVANSRPHFFKSEKAKTQPSYDFPLVSVTRATSAAPTFFPPELAIAEDGQSYPVVDGGMVANNPAMCAYADAREMGYKAQDIVMFSVGTGVRNQNYTYQQTKGWGALNWAVPIIGILMDAGPDAVQYQMQQLFADHQHQYVRVDGTLDAGVSKNMDDVSEGNIQALIKNGERIANENDAQLTELAQLLLAEEQQTEQAA